VHLSRLVYGNDGQLARAGRRYYAEAFDPVAYGPSGRRGSKYRGFWFMCLDEDVMPLADYLGHAKDYIDLVIDQSPSGKWRSSPACRNTTLPPTGS
jgi:phenylpropionate dioxygenase-like ring-hydroxylating dioxygenase large terminal subunit